MEVSSRVEATFTPCGKAGCKFFKVRRIRVGFSLPTSSGIPLIEQMSGFCILTWAVTVARENICSLTRNSSLVKYERHGHSRGLSRGCIA
jgi:hypothetical protein